MFFLEAKNMRQWLRTRPILFLSMFFTLSACSESKDAKGTFSDVAYEGQVLDARTKQALEGVHVYGYYALEEAGSHQSFEGVVVHRFHTLSDAAGKYSTPAWTKTVVKNGGRMGGGDYGVRYWPIMGFYKPGYELNANGYGGTGFTGIRNTVNPQMMKVIEGDDYKRFFELTASTRRMNLGECGWEIYAPLLVAQHVEYKQILKRAIPPEGLDAEGYPKSGFSDFREDRLRGRVGHKSARDELVSAYEKQKLGTTCANALDVLAIPKSLN
jgi:hypothetical protein